MATEYSIWCESIKKHINFNSEIIGDVEMFDLTTILSHFDQSNEDIVRWFTKHIDLLHMIDSIVTDDEISDDPELLSISEGTIICIDQDWYVNINVLIEYLRDIDNAFAHEILAQAMFNRDGDCSDCEYSDEPTEYDYSDESTCEEDDDAASIRSGRSI